MEAEIKELGGVPTIFVDGVPKAPMTYTGKHPFLGSYYQPRLKIEQYRRLGKAGIEIFFLPVDLGDPAVIDLALKDLDSRMKSLLSVVSNAKVILRTFLSPYVGFANENLGEVLTFNDGSTTHYLRPGYAGLLDGNIPRYTFASEAWESVASDALRRLVRHINNAAYRDHIIGYFIKAGSCGEWLYWGDWDHSKYTIDYSPAMIRAFRRWLINEYEGDVNKLREAWGDPQVDFSSAQIPSKEERDKFDFGLFWDPQKSRKVLDYYRCHNEVLAEKLIHFARLVKRESSNKILCGAFYGYLMCTHFLIGGQSVFKDVLKAEDVDFWASPPPYENRGIGDDAPFRFPTETLKLHGKLWVSEADTRTYTSGAHNVKFGAPKTVEDSIEVLKRDFAHILCTGVNGWWFEMDWGWYEHPKILETFSKMQLIGRLSLHYSRQTATDIAVIIDQESIISCSHDLTNLILHRERIHELPRIGAPYDYYELDDVLKKNVGPYKMYVLLNAFRLDMEERRLIDEKLKKNGNMLVWIYAPGLINPDVHPAIDVKNMEILTGIRLNYIKGRHRLRIKINNYEDPITKDLPKGTSFGDFDRPVTTGFMINEKVKKVKLPPVISDPLFYIDDPEATILGTYIENGKPGFAVKRFDNWTSVYVGSVSVSSVILRALAKASEAHLYSETDDIIYANSHFLAIHTNKAGERLIRLRKKADVYEVFDECLIGRDIDHFRINIPKYKTKLFFLGDVDEMKKKWATLSS